MFRDHNRRVIDTRPLFISPDEGELDPENRCYECGMWGEECLEKEERTGHPCCRTCTHVYHDEDLGDGDVKEY